ncbi:MAG TPA: sigma factor, partial [Humisphaera sp.]|nr:sigma factor [Humisphaera sp.]
MLLFFQNKNGSLARVTFDGLQPAGEGVTHQELADIYERHRRALFALALSITRCPAKAEDAVHDAFARLCRVSGRVAGDRVAYVFSAVRNAAVDQVRRGAIEQDVRRAQDVLFDLQGIDPRQQALDAERD